MAHKPEVKAAVLADLAKGMTQNGASKKHKVPIATVGAWHAEISKNGIPASVESRRDRFENALIKFFESTMAMLTAQAEVLTDSAYIQKTSSHELLQHTEFIAAQATRFVELARGVSGPSTQDGGQGQQVDALPVVAEPVGD